MSNIFSILGLRLKEARKKHGLSQDELANRIEEIIGTHPNRQTISNWEHGKTQPDTFQLAAICEILECDSGYFLGEHEEKTKEETDVCAFTGLTPVSIDTIRNLDNERLNTLNTLLSNSALFSTFLSSIDLYKAKYKSNASLKDSASLEDRLVSTCEVSSCANIILELLRKY